MLARTNYRYSGSYVKNDWKKEFSLVKTGLKKVKKRDLLIIQILLRTGITSKELVNLKKENFDYPKKTLIIFSKDSKNNKKRIISIDNELIDLIKTLPSNKSQHLISTKKSIQADVRTIQRTLEKFSLIMGRKITSVDLRKLFISNKLNEKPLDEVKKESGLKRFDQRKFLGEKDFKKLKKVFQSERNILLFELLSSGIKSHKIVNLKVKDIHKLSISSPLIEKLKKFSLENGFPQNEFVFLTRQKSHLSNERIFQIIKEKGKKIGIDVSPRILNNTAIARACFSNNPKERLKELGIKRQEFHLYGGFNKK